MSKPTYEDFIKQFGEEIYSDTPNKEKLREFADDARLHLLSRLASMDEKEFTTFFCKRMRNLHDGAIEAIGGAFLSHQEHEQRDAVDLMIKLVLRLKTLENMFKLVLEDTRVLNIRDEEVNALFNIMAKVVKEDE